MSSNNKDFIKDISDQYSKLMAETQSDTNAVLRKLSLDNKLSVAKIRKILITSGEYRSKESIEVFKLYSEGKSVEEISRITGMKKSTVNNYLPYTKGVYKKNDEPTLSNVRVRKHREKKIMEDPRDASRMKMPEHGIFFYSAGDLSVGYYIDSVKMFLLEYHAVRSLKEAIQAYNCYLFISNGISGKNWTEGEKQTIEINAGRYKSNVASYLSENPAVVLEELNELEYDYQRSILRMSVYFGIYKNWNKDAFFSVLNEENIYLILEIKQYSEVFHKELILYLKTNNAIATDIILSNNAFNDFDDPQKPKYYLPEKLDAKEKAGILMKYIKSGNASHANLVDIMHMPNDIKNKIDLESKEMAQRLINEKSKKYLESIDTSTISTEVRIEFSPGEKQNKPEKNTNGQYVIHYNTDNLDKDLTPFGIMKCLYSVFELFDQQNGIVLLSKRKRDFSIIDHAIGPKFINGYNLDSTQRVLSQMTVSTLNLYYEYLVSKGIHLEEVLGKGFTNLLKERHGIDGFGFELPVTDISFRFRAMHAATMIEDLFNRIHLLEKGKTIDQYGLEYSPNVIFSLLGSFLPMKYIYVTNEPKRRNIVLNIQYLLFSLQHVFYVKKIMEHNDGIRSNFELLLRYEITRDEIPDYDKPKVDFLLKNKCITEVNRCLKPTNKAIPLKEIWDYGCVQTYRTISHGHVLKTLISDGWLTTETTLLSRQEQALLSFLYNNRDFSDAWALRNYYVHAGLTELTEEQHKANYLWLLYIIIVLEMKFYEELDMLSVINEVKEKTKRDDPSSDKR